MTTTRWLFALQLVAMGAMEMSGPFWPVHLRRLGELSPHALAWVSAIAYAGPMAMAMCTTPWWGRLGDRVGHKPMLLRALLALAATQWWIAATDNVAVILSVRLLQGALAGYIAAAQAYGARLVTRAARGALLAQLQAATAIGSVTGPVIGGWLFDARGFASVNVLAGAACTFLKLDIEGAEQVALAGAGLTLERHQPLVAVCVYHRPEDIWTIPAFLRRALPRHRVFLRAHGCDGWELVAYFVPPARCP